MPSPLNYLVLLNTLYRLGFVLSSLKIGLFVSIVHWHFFSFRNFTEKLCVSWAFPLIECVAVWTLKLPVPHTDVLKPTSHKAFLRNYWKPKKLAANNCHKLRRNCLWFLPSHGKVIPLPSLLSFLQVLYHKLPV